MALMYSSCVSEAIYEDQWLKIDFRKKETVIAP
jgi:hypothetical protein